MITLLKVLLILTLSYFAAHGIIDRYRAWTRKKGVRFIIEVISGNDTIAINGIKEVDNFFISTEEEAILSYLQESSKEIVSHISSEEEVKKLVKDFLQKRNNKINKDVERILNQDKKDKS